MQSIATRVGPTGARIAGAIGLVAAIGLVLQYVLALGNAPQGALVATVRYFSYFTILSNLLVAIVALHAALRPDIAGFWSRPAVRGAAAVYIAVVLAIYDAVLRPLWNPMGAQLWADLGLHYLVPMGYLTWWLWFAPHGALRAKDVAWWLLFPAAFLAYTMVRGAMAHEWPYPFLDVGTFGAARVATSAAAVLAVLLGVGATVVLVDRMLVAAPRGDAM